MKGKRHTTEDRIRILREAAAGLETLGKVALLPAVLAVIFLVLLLTRKQTAPPPHA